MGPLVTVAATTGLRLGELLGLAWSALDEKAGTLTVRRSLARTPSGWALAEPKTKRSRRTIDLPTAALVAFGRQRELQDAARDAVGDAWQDTDKLVSTDGVGRPLRGSWVSHTYHDMLRAPQLPSIPFHGLRHTAATALLGAGVPLVVLRPSERPSDVRRSTRRGVGQMIRKLDDMEQREKLRQRFVRR